MAVPVPSPPSPQSPSTAASPSSWPPPSLPQSRPAPPLEPPAPPPSPQVPPLSPPPGPPNAFNCGRVATRARLDGAACYQLDSSHSIIAAAYLDCEQYYMSVPQHPGAVKLCYWDGAGQCRPSARFACLNVPPATPSPPQPPPPGPPTAPPPLTNCGRVATRINLTPSGAACYQLDSSHASIMAAHMDCEQYYMSVPQYPGDVKLCTWDGSAQCRASGRFSCPNLPPAVPSPVIRRLAEDEEAAGRAVYCAEHTSLVQMGSFAELATDQMVAFLSAHESSW